MKVLLLVALVASAAPAADIHRVDDIASIVSEYVAASGLPALKPVQAPHRFIIRIWSPGDFGSEARTVEVIQDEQGGNLVVGKSQDGKKWSLTGMLTIPLPPGVKQSLSAIAAFMKDPQTLYACPVKDGGGYTVEVATRDGYKAADASNIGLCDAKANKDIKQIVDFARAADKASGL